ncbi:hypothetical protein GN244_ATG13341 [Phytophthora infestans]|uniref:Uncharacterized protein n=1 Tax=Phytophthora infestans TaxID=4787 RepID=A0A833WHA8_PHYIN|nr:hypothetical protein GN244_ATG13341 [Phytophthora infestans]
MDEPEDEVMEDLENKTSVMAADGWPTGPHRAPEQLKTSLGRLGTARKQQTESGKGAGQEGQRRSRGGPTVFGDRGRKARLYEERDVGTESIPVKQKHLALGSKQVPACAITHSRCWRSVTVDTSIFVAEKIPCRFQRDVRRHGLNQFRAGFGSLDVGRCWSFDLWSLPVATSVGRRLAAILERPSSPQQKELLHPSD